MFKQNWQVVFTYSLIFPLIVWFFQFVFPHLSFLLVSVPRLDWQKVTQSKARICPIVKNCNIFLFHYIFYIHLYAVYVFFSYKELNMSKKKNNLTYCLRSLIMLLIWTDVNFYKSFITELWENNSCNRERFKGCTKLKYISISE